VANYIATYSGHYAKCPSRICVLLADRVSAEEIIVRRPAAFPRLLISGQLDTCEHESSERRALPRHPTSLRSYATPLSQGPRVVAAAVRELMRYLSASRPAILRIAIEDNRCRRLYDSKPARLILRLRAGN